ncbi:MAG: hypothetical protein KatS3mg031_0339 [Chitinophagales bacterium]|nr:MAG: hypothetical protein KatS3mg031_0339 [Chitinophagales bacterium]
MKLYLTPPMTLQQVNEAFQKEFRFLKLAFFKKTHMPGEPSSKEDMLDNSLTLEQAGLQKSCEINLEENMQVSRVEEAFKKCNLYAQVFRKSGNIWLETTKTDHYTLKEQMEEAKESETQYTYNPHNFADDRE